MNTCDNRGKRLQRSQQGVMECGQTLDAEKDKDMDSPPRSIQKEPGLLMSGR